MNYSLRGWQDKGKSGLAILGSKELILHHGYMPHDVVCNLGLNWPNCTCLNNAQMRVYVKKIVKEGVKHKIIIVDEADRVFPARFWHDREQTDALIGLVQDEKLFNHFFWTAHRGSGVDVLLRNATQIEIDVDPGYSAKDDCIYFTVYDQVDGIVYDDVAENVSRTLFPDYDRWKVIV